MKNETFRTKSISSAAAILATGKTEFLRIEPDPKSRLVFIHLTPKKTAEDLYRDLVNDKLEINASKNILWIEKLRSLIFEPKEKNDLG